MGQSVKCVLYKQHRGLSSDPQCPGRGVELEKQTRGSLVPLARQSCPVGEFWAQKEILFQKIRGKAAGGEKAPL